VVVGPVKADECETHAVKEAVCACGLSRDNSHNSLTKQRLLWQQQPLLLSLDRPHAAWQRQCMQQQRQCVLLSLDISNR
jgi:hypothetical protein